MISPELADALLDNAEVLSIVLRRGDMREMILSKPMHGDIAETFDLREQGWVMLIKDAMRTIFFGGNRIIRVIGTPLKGAGIDLETTQQESPLRNAMFAYGTRVFWLSAFISAITAALLFFSVRRFIVRPISKVVENMIAYGAAPDDPRRIITPAAGITELRKAEIGPAGFANAAFVVVAPQGTAGDIGWRRGADQPRSAQHADHRTIVGRPNGNQQ